MTSYLFARQRIAAHDPALGTFLARAHADKLRPLCMCTPRGVPMYVARVGDHHVIKRMPLSGAAHDADCESFEPPAELSGLGEVIGAAIREDTATGTTTLKLDVSLSKLGNRPPPASTGDDPDSVEGGGSRLTLRGLLHYLWEEAGLNKWMPAMAGKRSWFVVRKFLLLGATQKETKGLPLDAMLFVPEAFAVADKAEIERRRLAKLSRLSGPTSGATRKLMILVGEVKDVAPARYGHKLIVKHLPDMPFMLDEDLHRRMVKRFSDESALWMSDETTHLVVIATFGLDVNGIATIDELSLMVVTSNWIPVEHRAEAQLIGALVHEGRRFTKGLRYNMSRTKPLATAILTDCTPRPVAMYVVLPGVSASFREANADLIEGSDFEPWLWEPGVAPLPALPAIDGYSPAPHSLRTESEADYEAAH